MNYLLGEIKLFPYEDIPRGYLRCDGQALHINKYPRLYMLIGRKFGKQSEFYFRLPDLREASPEGTVYCIAVEGQLPQIIARGEKK